MSRISTNNQRRATRYPRGDTIIEVMFAITVFCLVAIISINLMNSGVSTAQASLELTMARNEIDAQAEALRFIQNSALAEKELSTDKQEFTNLWRKITYDPENPNSFGYAIDANKIGSFNLEQCSEAYEEGSDNNIFSDHAFVVNTRQLRTKDFDKVIIRGTSSNFRATPLYPRLVFTTESGTEESSLDENFDKLRAAEGIWVIAVKSDARRGDRPEFFDFHIRTCWYAPGRAHPSTIGTIVRLYNPEIIE